MCLRPARVPLAVIDSDDGDDARGSALTAWKSALRAQVDLYDEADAALNSEAREFLRKSIHQTRLLLDLADAPGAARADLMWRVPLEIWREVARAVLGAPPAAAAKPGEAPVLAYARALEEYHDVLARVGRETLAHVAEYWRERRVADGDDGNVPGGLRELLDLLVEEGEARYLQAVSQEHFAEIGGRLVNALTALAGAAPAGRSSPPADDAGLTRVDAGEDGARDAMSLLGEIGISPARAVEELRELDGKLRVALATLRDVGDIDVGTCPREAILRHGKMTLYRYRPDGEAPRGRPLLIVYALANRPYMLDLEPRRSLIRALMRAGLDVYLIDWGYPEASDRGLGLDHYVGDLIGRCVDRVRADHGLSELDVLGVCQGGTFALSYAALNPRNIGRLVLMVTPVDFHTPDNLLARWLRHVDVDALVDTLGNVPGELLNWAFVSLKPLRLTGYKYLEMLDAFDDPERARTFLRMEKWIHDSPAQAGEAFRQFTKDLFQHNRLVKGELRIGDARVDLADIDMPVLNVVAAHDHIVPPSASLALERHISSTDYATHVFDGGHIGIYVSRRAQREIPDVIAGWLLRPRDRPAGD